MNIIKCTSSVHTSLQPNRPIQYLVFHYCASGSSKKGTARAIATSFGNPKSRAASADFIVDDGEIVQYNPDIKHRYCYSVGGDKYTKLYTKEAATFYGFCRNYNSINVEICNCKKDKSDMNDVLATDWYFTDAALNNAVELGKFLMKEYRIPERRVLMHHHVTGKLCPQPWCLNNSRLDGWYKFKARLTETIPNAEKEESDLTEQQVKDIIRNMSSADAYTLMQKAFSYTNSLKESEWSRKEGAWARATKNGVVDGTSPRSPITREQSIAILHRLKLI